MMARISSAPTASSHVHATTPVGGSPRGRRVRAAARRPQSRVFIGGLGLGSTLRAALNNLDADAEVVVAELVAAVIERECRI